MNDNRLMLLVELVEITVKKLEECVPPELLKRDVSLVQELVEESITEMVNKPTWSGTKMVKKYELHNTGSQWDTETQIIMELGYFLRFNVPSAKDVANAMCSGTVAEYFRFMLLPCIANLIISYTNTYQNDSHVDVLNKLHDMFGDEMPIHPTLRGVIAIGEAIHNTYDIQLTLEEMKRNLRNHIGLSGIPDAKWYWDNLVEDALQGWVEMAMESIKEVGVTDDIDWTPQSQHQFLDEWYWDILANRIGWIPLDWEITSVWAIHDVSIGDMVKWAVVTDIGTRIKADYFPDEQLEWQAENR